MHASLNEDLIQPKKLEMGISHRTDGRTGHFDWGRHEITPGWSITWSEERTSGITISLCFKPTRRDTRRRSAQLHQSPQPSHWWNRFGLQTGVKTDLIQDGWSGRRESNPHPKPGKLEIKL